MNDPLISGTGWVEELIEYRGWRTGVCRAEEVRQGGGIMSEHAAEVVVRDPEVILASWCGKRVKTEEICSRQMGA